MLRLPPSDRTVLALLALAMGVAAVRMPFTSLFWIQAAMLLMFAAGERRGAICRRLRTFVYFLQNRQRQDELAREGRDIIAAIRALGERMPN